MSEQGYDFEFERRFVVTDLPLELLREPTLIVQSYFLAEDGYALRVRAQLAESTVDLQSITSPEAERHLLEEHADDFEFCAMTVKSPGVSGTRYEAEREIDVTVGLEMIRRGPHRIVKHRYAAWLGEDGWVIDVFAGDNAPLVMAEVERSGPVIDLKIPGFCLTEVTEDRRFSNDSLSTRPYITFARDFERDLKRKGPRFMSNMGENVR